VAYLLPILPREPALAATADRNENFMMVTAEVSNINNAPGVFVLDFLTGRLTGACLDVQTKTRFDRFFARQIAADFNVDPKQKATYSMVSGRATIPNTGRAQWGNAVIYVGEMSSGKVMAYKIPFYLTARGQTAAPLVPIHFFAFRGAEAKD
jgi:hypothetical protein